GLPVPTEDSSRSSTPADYARLGVLSVLSLCILIVWYWSVVISIGSSSKQLL
ncbi:hypothetical protein Pmar_PMAR015042, partial [Perkinsus marinus ATCC 50983]